MLYVVKGVAGNVDMARTIIDNMGGASARLQAFATLGKSARSHMDMKKREMIPQGRHNFSKNRTQTM